MYLKSLSLKGFKSFADRSVLSLEPGVTAIVGPNGSGKSNISDSVLWVLGERNAKNLRGQVMEDVIFAGSSARKSVGVAEVDLVLDNSDGSLPVDYTEVSVTRRMYRSGESEYLINGSAARRMDVLDILHDSGLGTGTYYIISQGNLDSILQSKPEDRRALIEEAAGVLKHKQRKLKSERRIEQMEQHLERVQDIVNEVSRQLGPLERKAKKAATYQDLSAQLTQLSLSLAVDDVRHFEVAPCGDAAIAQEGERGAACHTGIHLLNSAQHHERCRTFAHHLVGNRGSGKEIGLKGEEAVEVGDSASVEGADFAPCHHQRMVSAVQNLDKAIHHSVFCLSCSTNASMRCISAGILMLCGQCSAHCPQPMQWLAWRKRGTLRS